MPTGHFSIGDLSFSFDGDLKELAHCQEIIREIERAEQRLRRASSSQEVFLIYDRDLEGERGTFDKMRLRAYDDENNYTLDIGVTDTNPLGIYVGYDQNIEVYNRESGETWQIDPEGNRVESSEDSEETREEAPRSTQSSSEVPPSTSASGEGTPQSHLRTHPESFRGRAEIERAANTLLKHVRRHSPRQRVSGVTLSGGSLGEKIRGFAEYCGRSEGYLRRVLDTHGVSSVGELAVGQVPDVIGMIKDEEMLRQPRKLSGVEPDDELPF